MGEAEKNQGEKPAAAGPTAVVLKVDLHCEGCAQKVKKSLKHLNGVESVKADFAASKVTVVGNRGGPCIKCTPIIKILDPPLVGKVDPAAVKARVEEKTKKKVDLLSPQPAKKDNGGGDGGAKKPDAGDAKKSDEKSEKKPDEGKKPEENKPKEVPVATVVLKTRVHCDGCAHKMKKIISRYQGVQDVNVDLSKDQIAIKGTMDVKEMLPYLNAKLKRVVEVAPPPAKKDDGGGDKKPKDGGGDAGGEKKPKEEAKPAASGGDAKKGADGGGDKKEGAKPAAGEAAEGSSGKVEILNKMEHYGYPYGYGPQFYNPMQTPESGFVSEYWHAPPYMHAPPNVQGVPYPHAPPPYMHTAPQMFSDENPNACSVM